MSLACVWSVHACRRLQCRRDGWRLCLVSARFAASPVSHTVCHSFFLHVVLSALGGPLVSSFRLYGLLHRHRSQRVKRKKEPISPYFTYIFQNFRFIRPQFLSVHTVFMQVFSQFCLHGTPKTLKKQGLIKKRCFFPHFGGFPSPNTDLSDGQAGANCETFRRVKCMFTSSPHHAHAVFPAATSTFFN